MNKLEVFMCHSGMAERQMHDKLEEQENIIETLKKIITFQEKQVAMNSQKETQHKSADALNGQTDAFYKDLMDKMDWVYDLHDKMEAVQAGEETASLHESNGTIEKPQKIRID